jgi:hypothetical protein
MLRFLLALIVGLCLTPAADAGPLGRFLFRASHPFAPIGSYAGPKGVGSGLGWNNGARLPGNGAACGQAQSGPACSNGACSVQTAPTASPAQHGHQRHSDLHNRDAQGVANLMASRNYVGHFGGNRGYEGCGMAGSPQAAYSICCFANSGMPTVDVGYARGANGMWFCCRRYGR